MAGGACYSLGNARKVFARSHDGARFCSAGLPPGLRKTCGTFARSSKIRGSPHKPRGTALQIKKHVIALRRTCEPFDQIDSK